MVLLGLGGVKNGDQLILIMMLILMGRKWYVGWGSVRRWGVGGVTVVGGLSLRVPYVLPNGSMLR